MINRSACRRVLFFLGCRVVGKSGERFSARMGSIERRLPTVEIPIEAVESIKFIVSSFFASLNEVTKKGYHPGQFYWKYLRQVSTALEVRPKGDCEKGYFEAQEYVELNGIREAILDFMTLKAKEQSYYKVIDVLECLIYHAYVILQNDRPATKNLIGEKNEGIEECIGAFLDYIRGFFQEYTLDYKIICSKENTQILPSFSEPEFIEIERTEKYLKEVKCKITLEDFYGALKHFGNGDFDSSALKIRLTLESFLKTFLPKSEGDKLGVLLNKLLGEKLPGYAKAVCKSLGSIQGGAAGTALHAKGTEEPIKFEQADAHHFIVTASCFINLLLPILQKFKEQASDPCI